MLEVNEYLVLDHVREHGETSRPEISRALGLSSASVSRIIRRLVSEGLVIEAPGASSGGRPRSVLRFNQLAGAVIGVDLGGASCRAILADLAGSALAEDVRATGSRADPFGTLLSAVRVLREDAKRQGIPVMALAVGVAAIVDPATGVATGGPTIRWDGFPIVSRLASQLDLPFIVENDVNLAALAHAWRGDARGCSEFVVLSLGAGIGAGVVSDGRLLKGNRSAAGEVGYLVLDPRQIGAARTDGRGAFESLASSEALLARWEAGVVPAAGSRRIGRGRRRLTSVGALLAAAEAGDGAARTVVDELVDHVAMAIIALAATLDPELIVLDGSGGSAMTPLLTGLEERVAAWLPRPPGIVVSSLGPAVTALGAVAAALEIARTRRAPEAFADSLAVHVGHAPGRLVASVA